MMAPPGKGGGRGGGGGGGGKAAAAAAAAAGNAAKRRRPWWQPPRVGGAGGEGVERKAKKKWMRWPGVRARGGETPSLTLASAPLRPTRLQMSSSSISSWVSWSLPRSARVVDAARPQVMALAATLALLGFHLHAPPRTRTVLASACTAPHPRSRRSKSSRSAAARAPEERRGGGRRSRVAISACSAGDQLRAIWARWTSLRGWSKANPVFEHTVDCATRSGGKA